MDSRHPLPCCEVHGGPWVELGCLPLPFLLNVSRILPALQGVVRNGRVVLLAGASPRGISREAQSETLRATVSTHVLIPGLFYTGAKVMGTNTVCI